MLCGQAIMACGQAIMPCGQAIMPCGQAIMPCGQVIMPCGQRFKTSRYALAASIDNFSSEFMKINDHLVGAKTLRVALLMDTHNWAGTEAHIRDLALGLEAENVRVRVACPATSPLAQKVREIDGRVFPVARRGGYDPASVATLRRALLRREIDIVHAHNGRTALMGVLAVRSARRGRCILTQHFLRPAHVGQSGPKARLSDALHGFVARNLAHTIAISQAVKAAMLERDEVVADKVSVVLNGLKAPVPDAATTRENKRALWQNDENGPLIVCVARLQREKDLDILIAAMEMVRAKCPNARCIIAGEGDERANLSAQIAALGMQDAIELAGFVESVADLMSVADVFALPSAAEPFGLVLLEAMALGAPIVAVDAGGPPEIVVDGETGLLAPPRDADAMARAIIALVNDKSRAQKMGAAGRLRYEKGFTRERMARETRAVYERVLGIVG